MVDEEVAAEEAEEGAVVAEEARLVASSMDLNATARDGVPACPRKHRRSRQGEVVK